ncbi:acyl-CoA dehydrogenase family protein [Xanthobacter dioxanivorans]|uniref:Acyl-[acyl-carrier-protein] dehydrogenase MbtN n=1 Tax=Xanthobacter dioxanivorans TaxID=2528964 RepID=A0A974SKL4_9HYPH|nr:acyl-CoA dehydrogenase family protein [Xanthobacter dioxanivorans]QRG09611.1 acyl-CoA dehydrogenase family protein [Xanthobacter dioxanivorans]
MLAREVFSPEHDMLRETARKFFEREVAPHHRDWEKAGVAPRAIWKKAGEAGLLCVALPEEYGGAGADRLASAVLIEEQARLGLSGPGFSTHSDIVAPYIFNYGTPEQRARWLPAMVRGDRIGAIVLTEPSAGSDLRSIRTCAVHDGDDLVLNGQKTFITNGQCADLLLVAAKTGNAGAGTATTGAAAGSKDLTLLVVEAERAGVSRGKNFEKIGMKAQDTCELFFDNVRVPIANILGEEGKGFPLLSRELAWERLQIAIGAVATSAAALEWTRDYTRNRKAFGTPVADFQNTRFRLAEAKTEIEIAQVFVDRCLREVNEERLDGTVAAMAKYWCTELMGRVLDQCLQLHGGYGYMWEYPIARAYADARVHRIYGGSNEIMRELVARTL